MYLYINGAHVAVCVHLARIKIVQVYVCIEKFSKSRCDLAKLKRRLNCHKVTQTCHMYR